MNNDAIIVELLSEMLLEQKKTNMRLENVENRLERVENRIESVGNRIEKLEKQQEKTNLAIGELRLSVMLLAEKFEALSQLDKRIIRLEDAVFHA